MPPRRLCRLDMRYPLRGKTLTALKMHPMCQMHRLWSESSPRESRQSHGLSLIAALRSSQESASPSSVQENCPSSQLNSAAPPSSVAVETRRDRQVELAVGDLGAGRRVGERRLGHRVSRAAARGGLGRRRAGLGGAARAARGLAELAALVRRLVFVQVFLAARREVVADLVERVALSGVVVLQGQHLALPSRRLQIQRADVVLELLAFQVGAFLRRREDLRGRGRGRLVAVGLLLGGEAFVLRFFVLGPDSPIRVAARQRSSPREC